MSENMQQEGFFDSNCMYSIELRDFRNVGWPWK